MMEGQQRVSGLVGSPRAIWMLALLLLMALALSACQPLQAPPVAEAQPTPEMTEEAAEESSDEASAQLIGDAEAGAYVFNTTRGCGCHFDRDVGALMGGNEFEGDYGLVYAANITPDEATGIGAATDQQIADAIRFGVAIPGEDRDEGEALFIMPHFETMADQDVADLVAYLRAQEPVVNEVPARSLNIEVSASLPDQMPPAVAPTEGADRGRYLASLMRCGGCHTPANEDGSPNMDLMLAGAPFRDTVAPNLTSDEATGLGSWTEEEIVEFLRTGNYADGVESHAGMKGLSDRTLSNMTDTDLQAIAQFLQSLPPVENLP